MVNGKLANDLSLGRPILVLGDPGHLPPINSEGAFMEGRASTMLQIHRQALESAIIEVAMMAREGVNIQLGSYGNQIVKMRRADLTTKILMSADQVICGFNRTRAELNLECETRLHQPLPCGHPRRRSFVWKTITDAVFLTEHS